MTFPFSSPIAFADRIPNPVPSYSGLFPDDSPIYSSTTSPSLPLPILLSSLADMASPSCPIPQTYDLSMLTRLSLLSCTLPISIMAGPSQAFLVFNLSYVRQLSLRLDLLYQYQALASEVPRDRYTTGFLSCESPILRPIA